jgi:acetyltransferase-like isoleucine patch superfamily enzyme
MFKRIRIKINYQIFHACTKIYQFFKKIELQSYEEENRKYLKRMKGCGSGSGIYGNVHITGLEFMEIGSNVHIGNNAYIRAEGGLNIGDNTHISRNLVLYTINHDYEGEHLPYDEQLIKKSVEIGRNVWIGMNVCIAPGTKIGDGCIVGMGTVVSGNVPSLSIIGSEKWRIIGHRDSSRYLKHDTDEAYGGPNGVLFKLQKEK